MCVAKVSCFGLSLFKSLSYIVCFDIIFALIALFLCILTTYLSIAYNYSDRSNIAPLLLKNYVVLIFFTVRAIAGSIFIFKQSHTPKNRKIYFIIRTSNDIGLIVLFLIFNGAFDDYKIRSQLYLIVLIYFWVNVYTEWIIYSYWKSNEGKQIVKPGKQLVQYPHDFNRVQNRPQLQFQSENIGRQVVNHETNMQIVNQYDMEKKQSAF